jgi:hypothetical protein
MPSSPALGVADGLGNAPPVEGEPALADDELGLELELDGLLALELELDVLALELELDGLLLELLLLELLADEGLDGGVGGVGVEGVVGVEALGHPLSSATKPATTVICTAATTGPFVFARLYVIVMTIPFEQHAFCEFDRF